MNWLFTTLWIAWCIYCIYDYYQTKEELVEDNGMEWIEVNTPDFVIPPAGKYVVRTTRPHPALPKQRLTRRLEVDMVVLKNQNGVEYPVWGCTNQLVTHYLKEQ